MIGDIVITFLALLETTRREGRLIVLPCLALASDDPELEKPSLSPQSLVPTNLYIISVKTSEKAV